MFKKNYLFIIILIGIIIYILEFSGLIYHFFSKYNYLILHTVSNLPSSSIYSISGFVLGFFNILNYFYKSRIKVILIFLFSFYLGIKKIWFIKNERFKIFKIDFISIGFFLFFALFPFDKIKFNFFIFIVK